jgi:hypothetical protein
MRQMWLAGVVLLSVFNNPVQAAASAPASQPADGWISLFNGRNLEGWSAQGDGNFAVVDGAVCCEAASRGNGRLVRSGERGDFLLQMRFRCERGGSAVEFRAGPDASDPAGYAVPLDCSAAGVAGSLDDRGGRRLVPARLDVGPSCDGAGWNELEILAVGGHVQVSINGVLTADYNDARVARGAIALAAPASPGGRVSYRDIRLLPLKAGQAWSPLFNGRDLSGWRQLGEGRWGVEGGCIAGRSGPRQDYGWLLTQREYGDFVLKLKFKWHGGNSGVQFRSWVSEGHMHGYQADLDPTAKGMTGMLYDERESGALVQADPAIDAALRKDGWNTYEISAIGDHIQLFVNGIRSVDTRHGRTRHGLIALQVHSGGPVHLEWKDLLILQLDSPPPASSRAAR